MSYTVELVRTASRELARVPAPYHDAIVRTLRALEKDPRPSGCKKLVGAVGLWRIRVGPYRIVYSIEDRIRLVKVERVRDRKDVYR
ncbi:MAG TPA: type II toxin-antitoxin system RelE/ParE family toxin [Flavobacteriales bacterium]|nr:type II toxin-antitoxin system RelE/ParE family toxin [Flavobacteriales bacterium]